MLDQCREEELEHRLASFAPVLKVLDSVVASKKGAMLEQQQGPETRQGLVVEPEVLGLLQADEKPDIRWRLDDWIQQQREEVARQKAEEIKQLQDEGESRLCQLMQDALNRSQRQFTQDDMALANKICKQHSISTQKAKQILDNTKERWEAERLRQEGETNLASFMLQAMQRTQGQPTEEDTAATREICEKHGVSTERAIQILR